MASYLKLFNYFSHMGLSWFLFRVKYELLKKTPWFNVKNKKALLRQKKLIPFDITHNKLFNDQYKGDENSIYYADEAIEGRIRAFSNETYDYKVNNEINWHYNPTSKKQSPSNIPWNEIPDFGEVGDVKLIWEISRFPHIYFFINAYSVTKEEKYAKACVNSIISWCDENQYPNGVNYKCGQEISFRLISWIIALEFFYESFSKDQKEKILKNIYVSLLRVDANIDYAAKSVRNNHSISEAAGLLVGGLLFPQFPESKHFVEKGHKYLKKETGYQIYRDGSYIQHSFIYQRLALDILSFVIHVCKKKNFSLNKNIINGHGKMITFLNSFIQENGFLPNYGANDGANLFPLNSNAHYRDFRESLNLASSVNGGTYLFLENTNTARLFGYFYLKKEELEKKNSFEDGGYYILRDKNLFAFIRCHSYRDRPGHSDSLHLDVWKNGENTLCDSGTYSYNSDPKLMKDLKGANGHNTISVNDEDQMELAGRFGWSNWIKSSVLKNSLNIFEGEHYGYKKRFGVTHRRRVEIQDNGLIIKDTLIGRGSKVKLKQSWHTLLPVKKISSKNFEVGQTILESNLNGELEHTKISNFYNQHSEGFKLIFETELEDESNFETIIKI